LSCQWPHSGQCNKLNRPTKSAAAAALALIAERLQLITNLFGERALFILTALLLGLHLIEDGLAVGIGFGRRKFVDQGFPVGDELTALGIECVQETLHGLRIGRGMLVGRMRI
jgi:zinc transporter ZupT